MSEIDQGGFVYPQVTYEYGGEMHHIGITLRQHYAGLAMQAMVSAECEKGRFKPNTWSKLSFELADAMIEAGKQ